MFMTGLIKKIARSAGFEITRTRDNGDRYRVAVLMPKGQPKGNVLLSYMVAPFLRDDKQYLNRHAAQWECKQIAQTFLDVGYSVDAIYHQNNRFLPEKDYAFFVDVHENLERIGPQLNEDCVKILHLTWSHWMFHNYAEYKRHLDLQRRRGITLRPARQLNPVRAIEYADCATIIGNDFTMSTYGYVGKPMYRVPVSSIATYPFPVHRDLETSRKNFIWLGGYGSVHKGLDLVLDAFTAMPDYHLFICGYVEREKEFMKAYERELYHLPNIHLKGWTDVTGPEFRALTDQCIGLLHPSCAEGQAGSVINGLHSGLIPVVSRESGVDVDEFGIMLSNCSVEEIRDTVCFLSSLPSAKLEIMARKGWEYARTNHTRERFAHAYRSAIDDIMSKRQKVYQ
jgi:glycosyltransferase involved in cell wall biosynthesis